MGAMVALVLPAWALKLPLSSVKIGIVVLGASKTMMALVKNTHLTIETRS